MLIEKILGICFFTLGKDADEATVKAFALEDEKVEEQTDGKTIRKIIFIPGKIFNIVAN